MIAAACLLHACHITAPGATGNGDITQGSGIAAAPGTITTQTPGIEPTPPFGVETVQPPVSESFPVLSGGVLLPNGLLPDGGYTHQATPERYYDNTVLDLIPSAGYGRIWPYIGGYATSNMGTWSELIGICDDSGRIICDPAYNDVTIIEYGGNRLYAFTKNEVSRSNGHYEDIYVTTIAALDGSWAETFERALWRETSSYEYSPPLHYYGWESRGYQWRDALSYEYITARRGGLWGVIGWDGSVLLPFEYHEPVCFNEGLASVLSANGETYSFIDKTGNTILGPYQAPPRAQDLWDHTGFGIPITSKIMFYEGYAKFYKDGKFGIIDRTGNIIIPAVYDFITCMNGGMAVIVAYGDADDPPYMQERCGIVNSSGDEIVPYTYYNYRYYCGPRYIEGQVVIAQIYNPVGDIIAYDGTKTPYEDNTPYISENGKEYIFRNSDVAFPLSDYLFDYVNYDLIMIYDRYNSTWRLYDFRGNPVSSENPGRLDHWYNDGNRVEYLFINISPPGVWEWPPPVMIYDITGRLLLEDAYYTIKPIEDKFMVRGKSSAGLVDAEGNFIIEASIAAYDVD